ncbi:DUF2076 domain-containing protein [Amycolatopsis keratiniphila]|uniref:DUF2076 domain-containing protein n=1 Tax=Amycolatopsis keratiniphila TaxID=129921 RepID=UPI00087B431C|nr:DUF2076 family protein [Amycolatopsis keratiniphila]OLZ49923.1 hypothetical protein BS330_31905 [Amycolatopsis keratiniphila subsp. nogabecina]SDU26012.1 hypothetical protein SAMN04489733_2493 [Amycolatopsis keratiniphila]
MEHEDRQLIFGLAERLRQAQPVYKDPEVADLISRQIAGQPDAMYLLVGAVLMQEDALRNAKTRIAELEHSAPYQDPYGNHRDPYAAQRDPYGHAPAQSGGGFLSGMFGRGRDTGEEQQGRPGGGGFLKTAAAAAAGVAGGGLLLGGLTGAFGGNEASAGEQQHHGGQDGGMDHGGDDQW